MIIAKSGWRASVAASTKNAEGKKSNQPHRGTRRSSHGPFFGGIRLSIALRCNAGVPSAFDAIIDQNGRLSHAFTLTW
jgi:hypothetical protein